MPIANITSLRKYQTLYIVIGIRSIFDQLYKAVYGKYRFEYEKMVVNVCYS